MSNSEEAVLWLVLDEASGDSPLARQLAAYHRVVTVPANDVRTAVPQLGRFVLVGQSNAAEAALALARNAGDACAALILIAPVFTQLPAPDPVPDMPMLLLLGTEDVRVPASSAAALCAALPRAHPILIYGAGHALDRERVEAVSSVMRDFIARREKFIVRDESDLLYP